LDLQQHFCDNLKYYIVLAVLLSRAATRRHGSNEELLLAKYLRYATAA
jgi:hypothetical protein